MEDVLYFIYFILVDILSFHWERSYSIKNKGLVTNVGS